MSKRPPKKQNIQPIRDQEAQTPASDSAVAVEDPPATPEALPAPETARPPFKKKDPAIRHMTFFDRVASISLADWGTRAKIKVYRLDPIIDRTRGSEHKFVVIYHEPIDENKLKMDHGSGRYRLYLNIKTAGEKQEREADTVEIDVLDPAFPPKIPAGEWVDDPRNKKWAWARPNGAPGGPPEAPPPQAAASAFSEAIKTYSEIRKDVRQEVAPATAATPAPTQEAALAGTLQLVTTILGMKAENPMTEVYKEEMKALREEIKEERAENRRLAGEAAKKPEPEKKNGIGQIQEWAEALEKLSPTLQKLLPSAGEALQRGHRTNWLDIVQGIAPSIVDTLGKVSIALASSRGVPAPTNGAYPPAAPQAQIAAAPNPGQPAAPQQPNAEQRIMSFLMSQSRAMLNYFQSFMQGDAAGSDFANWIYDGYHEQPLIDARAVGADRIMELFKLHPQWPALAPHEAKMREFLADALVWKPDAEEEADEPEGVDLTTGKGV